MSTLAFYAQFTKTLVGVNSLSVTWDVEQITRSDGTRSALVTGGATSITIGRRGLYGYLLVSADTKLYDYVATAITAGDVDQKEIAALWTQYETDGVKPTVSGRTLDVSATGEAGVDWANVGSPTTAVDLTNTQINSVSGSIGGDVAGKVLGGGASAITGTGASANVTYLAGVALTSGAIPAAVAGATGGLAIVGSAMTLADDAITAAKIAANAIGSSELAASAASEIATAVWNNSLGVYSNALTINDGSNPLDGVFIQVSTDSGKTSIVWAGYTNSLGQVTAYSDTAGTHYAWMQLSGYTFTNPTSITMA